MEGAGTFDVEEDMDLVLAIEEDTGVDIMHRCGSYARCTICRVEFLEGAPDDVGVELAMLVVRNLLRKVCLSCLALCARDMKVRVL